MNIKDIGKKIDKKVLLKAVGVMLLGWLALPIVYYILLRQEKDMDGIEGKEDEEK